MSLNIELQIEKLTKLSLESQNQKLRLFARVDTVTKLKIFQSQKQIFHKLKSQHSQLENELLTLVSLIVAISQEMSSVDDTVLKSLIFRAKNARKKAKRGKILDHWAIIKTLKIDQKMSFRDIAAYLKKYHKIDVAHSTIYGLWLELEK